MRVREWNYGNNEFIENSGYAPYRAESIRISSVLPNIVTIECIEWMPDTVKMMLRPATADTIFLNMSLFDDFRMKPKGMETINKLP